MKRPAKALLLTVAFSAATIPLLSQTAAAPKPSFEVISIKPSAPLGGGAIRIGGGARGDRYTMTGATLRLLLQQAYSQTSAAGQGGQIQLIGGPSWMDTDRYDIQATADCSGGVLSPEQVQLMIQSMLESRFQLKAHRETRELPAYELVVAKDGPKIKPSSDQTPTSARGGLTGFAPQPCAPASATADAVPPPPPAQGQRDNMLDPNFQMPRGSTGIMISPAGLAIRGSAVPITNLVGSLQQQLGRPVIDKTGLKGLFDFILQFSREGLNGAGLPGVATPFGPAGGGGGGGGGGAGPAIAPTTGDPVPTLFTAIQDLGLRLESTKGSVEVLVIDSAQKPTEN